MAIFHHPFTDIKKLSDSLPFEPDNFLQYPDQESPSILGSKGKERYSSRIMNDQMPDDEGQSCR